MTGRYGISDSARFNLIILCSVVLIASSVAFSADADPVREQLQAFIVRRVESQGGFKARIITYGRELEALIEGATDDGLEFSVRNESQELDWADIDERSLAWVANAGMDGAGSPADWAALYTLIRRLDGRSEALNILARAARESAENRDAINAVRKSLFGDDPDKDGTGAILAGASSPDDASGAAASQKPPVGVLGDPHPSIRVKPPVARPRIFIRADSEPKIPGVPTLSEFQKRAKTGSVGYFYNRAKKGPNETLSDALIYLIDGDETCAKRAIKSALALRFDGTTNDGLALRTIACVYDWCYPVLSDADKKRLADRMREWIPAVRQGFLDRNPHIFHTRMNSPPYGILCAGIALTGDDPKAQEYIDYAMKFVKEKTFPGWQYLDGGMPNGMTYGAQYNFTSIAETALAWRAFSGENIFYESALNQNNWLERQLLFAIHNRLPNGMLLPYGDFAAGTLSTDRAAYISFLLPLACGTRLSQAMDFLEMIRQGHGNEAVDPSECWRGLLFWDPEIPRKDYKTLPAESLFGSESLGMWIGRTGWDANAVIASFRCGDNFDNHQHHDSGHFYIFRKTPLALDSGAYTAGFDTPARTQYYWRSVAHNTYMFDKPGDNKDGGGQRIVSEQNTSSVQEQKGNNDAETGNILRYEPTDRYIYLCADAKPAYPSYCEKFIRHFLFIQRTGTIVLFDEVAVQSGRRMAFLLHTENEILAAGDRRWTTEWNGSMLTIDSLTPKSLASDIIGGPGKEFWTMGRNFPHKRTDNYPSGAWRLELYPPIGTQTAQLVTVIQTTDSGSRPARPTYDGSKIMVDGLSIVFAPGGGASVK